MVREVPAVAREVQKAEAGVYLKVVRMGLTVLAVAEVIEHTLICQGHMGFRVLAAEVVAELQYYLTQVQLQKLAAEVAVLVEHGVEVMEPFLPALFLVLAAEAVDVVLAAEAVH
jgi:hypothetical protein